MEYRIKMEMKRRNMEYKRKEKYGIWYKDGK